MTKINGTKEQLQQALAKAHAEIASLKADKSKQNSESISEQEKFLRHLIDINPNLIFVKDREGRFLLANQALAELYGTTVETILGKTDADFNPDAADVESYLQADLKVMQSLTDKLIVEESIIDQMGNKRWLQTIKRPIVDQDGVARRILGVSTDITKLKYTEASLQEERNILRILIDNLPDHIYVKDAASRFVLNNVAHLHSMGATSFAEVLGKTDLDMFPQELAAQYYADEQAVLQSGQPLVNREELVEDQSTGEKLWFLTTKVPVSNEQGKIIGLVGMSRNITTQKHAEQERERLQQEVIEAQQKALKELSTPVIPIMDRIIVMPLVGSIDSIRGQDITRSLLAGISRHQAKFVILDVTGVSLMDTGTVNHLNKTIQAARLKGAQTIVTGITDAVAESIVELGTDWSDITTLSDLQTGLVVALKSLGIALKKAGMV